MGLCRLCYVSHGVIDLMLYSFDFDLAHRILRCQLHGRVTDEVLKECYRAIAEYVAQIDPRAGIMDLSAVTSFEVSREAVRELARSAPAVPDPNRVRIVVAPSDCIFGMARMFQIEGERTRPNLHIVRSLAEAWAVLGVQDFVFEQLETK